MPGPGSGPVKQLAIALECEDYDREGYDHEDTSNCRRTLTGGTNGLSLSSSNSFSFSLFLTKCIFVMMGELLQWLI